LFFQYSVHLFVGQVAQIFTVHVSHGLLGFIQHSFTTNMLDKRLFRSLAPPVTTFLDSAVDGFVGGMLATGMCAASVLLSTADSFIIVVMAWCDITVSSRGFLCGERVLFHACCGRYFDVLKTAQRIFNA
jgi:hypothetical protein